MLIILMLLILLVCILLGAVVLIQNPKGGGLSSTFGGVSNQILGANRSTDVVEKATWVLGVALMALSLVSGVFYEGGSGASVENLEAPAYEERLDEVYDFPVSPAGQEGMQQQNPSQPAPPAQQPE